MSSSYQMPNESSQTRYDGYKPVPQASQSIEFSSSPPQPTAQPRTASILLELRYQELKKSSDLSEYLSDYLTTTSIYHFNADDCPTKQPLEFNIEQIGRAFWREKIGKEPELRCVRVVWENRDFDNKAPLTCITKLEPDALASIWKHLEVRGWKDRLVADFVQNETGHRRPNVCQCT